jgi:hypothetical protein
MEIETAEIAKIVHDGVTAHGTGVLYDGHALVSMCLPRHIPQFPMSGPHFPNCLELCTEALFSMRGGWRFRARMRGFSRPYRQPFRPPCGYTRDKPRPSFSTRIWRECGEDFEGYLRDDFGCQ